MRVLVCGLSGSGKTVLCTSLVEKDSSLTHINADEVRGRHDDWDFSLEGRRRQLDRMISESKGDGIYLLDFICPTQELRDALDADVVIWMDTVRHSQYPDTDKLFEKPDDPDLIINCFWEDSVMKSRKLIEVAEQSCDKRRDGETSRAIG